MSSRKEITLGELYMDAVRLLKEHGALSCENDAAIIVSEASGVKRAELYLSRGCPASAELCGRVMSMAGRRAKGEPLQYIIGLAWFRDLELTVGPGDIDSAPRNRDAGRTGGGARASMRDALRHRDRQRAGGSGRGSGAARFDGDRRGQEP